MNALYKNRIYNVVDVTGDITLDGPGITPFDVSFSDPDLQVEPTDYEVADADNLEQWYGVDADTAAQLRIMLLGRITLSEWDAWKASRYQR